MDIITLVQRHKLRWYGLVLRKDENNWVKCVDYDVEGVRPRDRSKKTWSEVIQKDCQTQQICKKMICIVGNGESQLQM